MPAAQSKESIVPKHASLGERCRRCNAPADVVATWLVPTAERKRLGTYRHEPLCAHHVAYLTERGEPPWRMEEHARAARERRKAEKAAHAADLGEPLALGEWTWDRTGRLVDDPHPL
jgi:hypothetical protein